MIRKRERGDGGDREGEGRDRKRAGGERSRRKSAEKERGPVRVNNKDEKAKVRLKLSNQQSTV